MQANLKSVYPKRIFRISLGLFFLVLLATPVVASQIENNQEPSSTVDIRDFGCGDVEMVCKNPELLKFEDRLRFEACKAKRQEQVSFEISNQLGLEVDRHYNTLNWTAAGMSFGGTGGMILGIFIASNPAAAIVVVGGGLIGLGGIGIKMVNDGDLAQASINYEIWTKNISFHPGFSAPHELLLNATSFGSGEMEAINDLYNHVFPNMHDAVAAEYDFAWGNPHNKWSTNVRDDFESPSALSRTWLGENTSERRAILTMTRVHKYIHSQQRAEAEAMLFRVEEICRATENGEKYSAEEMEVLIDLKTLKQANTTVPVYDQKTADFIKDVFEQHAKAALGRVRALSSSENSSELFASIKRQEFEAQIRRIRREVQIVHFGEDKKVLADFTELLIDEIPEQ